MSTAGLLYLVPLLADIDRVQGGRTDVLQNVGSVQTALVFETVHVGRRSVVDSLGVVEFQLLRQNAVVVILGFRNGLVSHERGRDAVVDSLPVHLAVADNLVAARLEVHVFHTQLVERQHVGEPLVFAGFPDAQLSQVFHHDVFACHQRVHVGSLAAVPPSRNALGRVRSGEVVVSAADVGPQCISRLELYFALQLLVKGCKIPYEFETLSIGSSQVEDGARVLASVSIELDGERSVLSPPETVHQLLSIPLPDQNGRNAQSVEPVSVICHVHRPAVFVQVVHHDQQFGTVQLRELGLGHKGAVSPLHQQERHFRVTVYFVLARVLHLAPVEGGPLHQLAYELLVVSVVSKFGLAEADAGFEGVLDSLGGVIDLEFGGDKRERERESERD